MMSQRHQRAGMMTVMLIGIAAVSLSARADCRLESGPERSVAQVIDSDTVQLDDGSHVRLVGALGPRALDVDAAKGTWPSETAAKAALETLVAGKAVALKFGGVRKDRHDRWLAHLFVRGETGDVWVQGRLLAAGSARAYGLDGNRACLDELLAEEAKAVDATAGLWAVPAYRIRVASPARDLLRFVGTFQVVRGRVETVSEGRETVRLYLGPDRRRDVSISIRRSDRALLGTLGGRATSLEGREIEVRGWIGQRAGAFAGPDVDLSTAGHLRLF